MKPPGTYVNVNMPLVDHPALAPPPVIVVKAWIEGTTTLRVEFDPHPLDWVLRGVSLNRVHNDIMDRGWEGMPMTPDEEPGCCSPPHVLAPRRAANEVANELRRWVERGAVVADGVRVEG